MDGASLFTLIGVVVGALVSYATSTLNGRVEWRRVSSARWEGRLFDSIVAFASSLKMQSRTCLRISGSFWPTMTTNPLDPTTGRDLLAQFEDERSSHFERLLLLAPDELVSSARAWQRAVWALHVVQDGEGAIEAEVFEQLLSEAGVRRDGFYFAARTVLGVSGVLASPEARALRSDPTWQAIPKPGGKSELGELADQ